MRHPIRLTLAALALPSAHHTLVAACRYYSALQGYRALDPVRTALDINALFTEGESF